MQAHVNFHLPRHHAELPLAAPAEQPAAPAQGLAARRVALLQMPRTLCRLAYGAFTTGTLAAGSAALSVLGAQARQDPQSEMLGQQMQGLGAILGLGAFTSLCATVSAVRQAYDAERAALPPRPPAVVIEEEEAGGPLHEVGPSRAEGEPSQAEGESLEPGAPGQGGRPPSPESRETSTIDL